MLIGKYWDAANQKYFWAESSDFDNLIENIKFELGECGADDEIDPAKVQVWSAVKMKVVATYEIQAGD